MLMSRTGVQATWLRDRPRQELERLGGADGSRIVLVSNEALSLGTRMDTRKSIIMLLRII
jgi:hypothetical protein